ncbi:hypothetical protein BOX15_Mlig032825g4, partial [Macrostomum lignano]
EPMGAYLSSSAAATAAASSAESGNPLNSGIPRTHRRVLIAIDESLGAQKAFDFWSGVARSQDDSILLVNAVEVPNVPTGLLLSPTGSFDYSEYQKQTQPLLERAQRLKANMMAKCEQRKLRCKFITEVGSPATAVLDAAKTFSASVIVVGCCGHKNHLLGSVSNYILQHSCRPVVIVPRFD